MIWVAGFVLGLIGMGALDKPWNSISALIMIFSFAVIAASFSEKILASALRTLNKYWEDK